MCKWLYIQLHINYSESESNLKATIIITIFTNQPGDRESFIFSETWQDLLSKKFLFSFQLFSSNAAIVKSDHNNKCSDHHWLRTPLADHFVYIAKRFRIIRH